MATHRCGQGSLQIAPKAAVETRESCAAARHDNIGVQVLAKCRGEKGPFWDSEANGAMNHIVQTKRLLLMARLLRNQGGIRRMHRRLRRRLCCVGSRGGSCCTCCRRNHRRGSKEAFGSGESGFSHIVILAGAVCQVHGGKFYFAGRRRAICGADEPHIAVLSLEVLHRMLLHIDLLADHGLEAPPHSSTPAVRAENPGIDGRFTIKRHHVGRNRSLDDSDGGGMFPAHVENHCGPHVVRATRAHGRAFETHAAAPRAKKPLGEQ